MKEYKVFFLKEGQIVWEILEAAYFTSITVASNIASTTVIFYDITGVVDYSYGSFRIEPRNSSDVE